MRRIDYVLCEQYCSHDLYHQLCQELGYSIPAIFKLKTQGLFEETLESFAYQACHFSKQLRRIAYGAVQLNVYIIPSINNEKDCAEQSNFALMLIMLLRYTYGIPFVEVNFMLHSHEDNEDKWSPVLFQYVLETEGVLILPRSMNSRYY